MDVRALFTRPSLWQSWLDVEAALAETQAELGIIPAEAAAEIARKAHMGVLDPAALAADIERTRAPIVSLTRALASACADGAGSYVHWGATTQNVMQTGRILLMRRAHAAFMRRFADILLKFAALAETEAETVTIARTNHRHALPVTFGFKVAAWIEEWLRHLDRFEAAAPRVFCTQWGGAVGAMHAVGPVGPELNRRLAARLGLGCLTVPARSSLDSIAEYVLLLGLFAATCGKIARDLYALMGDELGEVSEHLGDDVVGSSTMPHKTNPKIVVQVIALAARVRHQVPLALEAMQPSFEGDAANNQMLAALIDETCPLAFELVAKLDELLGCLRLDPARMRHNLDTSGQVLATEQAMMALAPILGRGQAHDLVHHAVAEAARRGIAVLDAILASDTLPESLPAHVLAASLDASSYIGLSTALATDMAAAARRAVADRLTPAP